MTDLNRDFLASEAGQKLQARIPSRRFGEPEDLDGPLLLLASDAGCRNDRIRRDGRWRPPGELAMNGLSTPALAGWLRSQGLSNSADVALKSLTGGQSNPTFLVDDGARRFVLRKKPAGQLLASAHAIDREYRVMRALQDSDVPVPRMLGYCEDDSILGTPFFVMEFLDGRVFMDQSLPGIAPAERAAIYAT